ncbi:MAG: purine-binding chemotaxis protein CheW [Pseudomonas sp.]|uniref:chemotaxis protein CheW n=1 Tax=Pseudomonas sp. TaxID=306 RepID=UPI0012122757|nr:chemotaxis protein CheW [Pseudomonas sp.]RZI76421.1 MAG: purine-binding chemotaxis protein CheW [Pseudomonas sp.]
MTRAILAEHNVEPTLSRAIYESRESESTKFELFQCWKRIGIEGDKSCEELPRHAHCRNCPTYSFAATALLDRELTADRPHRAVQHCSTDLPIANARTASATVFRLGSEWFALPTLAMDEVTGQRAIHSLPHRRNSILLGLVNLHGELVVCVSIAELIGGRAAPAPMSAQARLIVVRLPRGRIALPVEEVLFVHHYTASELRPLPTTLTRSPSRFTKGLLACGDRMVGLLDEQALFAALSASLT